MNYEEHNNIQKEDFRLQAVTTVVGDTMGPAGITHKDGSPVKLIAGSLFSKVNSMTFGLPNMAALYLNLARKLHEESNEPISKHDFAKRHPRYTSQLGVYDDAAFFNLLEKRIASVIFAYTAVEAFANMQIPKEYIYRRQRKDKKWVEELNKEQIERFESLKEKLAVILPDIFKIKTPKNKRMWRKVVELEETRNRLIHIKSQDVRSTGVDENSVWQVIVKQDFANYPAYALEIIMYFVKDQKPPPRWIAKFPAI